MPSPTAAEFAQNEQTSSNGPMYSSGSSAKLVTSNGDDAEAGLNGSREAYAGGDNSSGTVLAAAQEPTSAEAPSFVQQESSHVEPAAISVPQDASKIEEDAVPQSTTAQELLATPDANTIAPATTDADTVQPETARPPEPVGSADGATSDGAGGVAAPALTFLGGYGSNPAGRGNQTDEPAEEAAPISQAPAAAATT